MSAPLASPVVLALALLAVMAALLLLGGYVIGRPETGRHAAARAVRACPGLLPRGPDRLSRLASGYALPPPGLLAELEATDRLLLRARAVLA